MAWQLTPQQLTDLGNARGKAIDAENAVTPLDMMTQTRLAMILMEMQLIYARNGKRSLALSGQSSDTLNTFINDLQSAIEHLGHAWMEVVFSNDMVTARNDLATAAANLTTALDDYDFYAATIGA